MATTQSQSINIYNFSNNLTNYIKLSLNISSKPLSFLVDTEVDLSLIKLKSIDYHFEIIEDSKIDITGITKTSA